jgi:hypothetical protein
VKCLPGTRQAQLLLLCVADRLLEAWAVLVVGAMELIAALVEATRMLSVMLREYAH